MPSPWTVAPALDPRRIELAHERAVSRSSDVPGIRRLVLESWTRSLDLSIDPDAATALLALDDDALRDYREQHPLHVVLPTIRHLLVRHTYDTGLIVAVGDETGRLLWVDGDHDLKRKAEAMRFVEGADWSEATVGTSAPGTALRLDHGIQIQRAEHFTRIVHPWSCSAVPVHDPATGSIIGVIDITGGDEAVAPQSLPLIEATVAAVEAELRVRQLENPRQSPSRRTAARPSRTASLHALGRSRARLDALGASIELSPRHSEILTLLAWHRDGLSAERLSDLLNDGAGSTVTLRAELVRLRRVLRDADPTLTLASRPYRFERGLDLDLHRVLAFLDRGAHRVALAAYEGVVLPASTAPGIGQIRSEVSARLRERMLADAAIDSLLRYARTEEAALDAGVWRACLKLLPARSPKRAAVVARLEWIEGELATAPPAGPIPAARRGARGATHVQPPPA